MTSTCVALHCHLTTDHLALAKLELDLLSIIIRLKWCNTTSELHKNSNTDKTSILEGCSQ